MSVEALFASELVSTVLALVLAYLFVRAYKLTHSSYLLGLPVGFSFLAFSYVFLALHLSYESNAELSEQFMWLKFVTQTCGFAFIAFTYYFSSKTERTTKYSLFLISLASAVTIISFFIALLAAPPFPGELPPVSVIDEWLRILGLVLLGYVIVHVVRHMESLHQQISGFWAPTAFSLLWLGQYSSLIADIDGSQSALYLAHAARLASLVLFIRIYYSSGRAKQ